MTGRYTASVTEPKWANLGAGHVSLRKCDYGQHGASLGGDWVRWQRVLWICPTCVQVRAAAAAAAAAEAAA